MVNLIADSDDTYILMLLPLQAEYHKYLATFLSELKI